MNAADRWELRVQLAAHPVGYPLLRLLSRRPAQRVPGLGVVVSDAALARELISDPARFSKTGPGSPSDLWTPVLGPTVLLNMDGEAHLELRRKLAPLFGSRAVEALCARAGARIVQAARERWVSGCPVDAVAVAKELTGAVVCELVGLHAGSDRADLAAALQTAAAVAGLIRLRRRGWTPDQVTRAKRAMAGLIEPAERAYRAGGDTVPGRMADLGLTRDEAVGAVGAFVLVGTETLVSFLPRLLAITHDAGLWPEMAEDQRLRLAAIQEALRVTVPSPVMLRSAECATGIGDVAVRTGDRIIVATASACRTSATFDPNSTDAARLRNLWFGAGPHFCLGMPLATAEIDLMLDAVLTARRHRTIVVLHRKTAHRVLIPGYRRLVIGSPSSGVRSVGKGRAGV